MSFSIALSERARSMLEVANVRTGVKSGQDVPYRVREAAAAALDRGETHYTDRPGIRALREAVASLVERRFGVNTSPDNIVITCGDTEARFVAVQQLVPRGGAVAALATDHGSIAGPTLLGDAQLVECDHQVPDRDAADLLYIDASLDPAVVSAWVQAWRESDRWVVYDVTHAPDQAFHPEQVGMAQRTVTVGGLGYEAGMEGWRVGYLAAPPTALKQLRAFKQALTICTTNVSQWAALALFEEATP